MNFCIRWATIIGSTLAFRFVAITPLYILQQRKLALLQNVKHEMDDFVKELKKELSRAIKVNRWTEKEAKHHYNYTVLIRYSLVITLFSFLITKIIFRSEGNMKD